MGNRPLLEYWIEFCVEAGIREIRLVLGDGAEEIEQYVGDGRRWGVQVGYSFLRGQLRCGGQPLLFAVVDEVLREELKHYRPGALSYADLNPLPLTTAEKRVDALYYERRASVLEDTRLFFSTLLRRLFGQFDRGEEPSW